MSYQGLYNETITDGVVQTEEIYVDTILPYPPGGGGDITINTNTSIASSGVTTNGLIVDSLSTGIVHSSALGVFSSSPVDVTNANEISNVATSSEVINTLVLRAADGGFDANYTYLSDGCYTNNLYAIGASITLQNTMIPNVTEALSLGNSTNIFNSLYSAYLYTNNITANTGGVKFGSSIDANLIPYTNNTRTLGSALYKWASIYGTDLYIDNITTALSTGILHSASGTISSSLIVDADVSSSASIQVSKLLFNGSVNPYTTNTYYLGSPLKKWAYIYSENADIYSTVTSLLQVSGLSTGVVHSSLTGVFSSSAVDLTSEVTGILPNANTTATSSNTASAIVARDGSGNFTAGTITGTITSVNLTNDSTSGNSAIVFSSTATGSTPLYTNSSLLYFNPILAILYGYNIRCQTLSIYGLSTGILHSDSGGNITSSYIVNNDVSASAAIAYSKLNLSSSIVNTDVSASAAIAYSKLNLSGSIVNADVSASAAIAYSKLSLSNSIVNSDISSSAAIVDTKLATISTAGKVSNSATTATSSNTASAIVSRDASGNFNAGTITASLSGNATSSTTSTTATNANNVNLANDTANATDYLVFANSATGNQALKTNASIICNPSTNQIGDANTNFNGYSNSARQLYTYKTTSPNTYYFLCSAVNTGSTNKDVYQCGGASPVINCDFSTGQINSTTFAGDLNGTINTVTTGTTQSAGDNSTKIATTQYVDRAITVAYAYMTCSSQSVATGTATQITWGTPTYANCSVGSSSGNWYINNNSGSTQNWLVTYSYSTSNSSSSTKNVQAYISLESSNVISGPRHARNSSSFGLQDVGVGGSEILIVPNGYYVTFVVAHDFGSNVTFNQSNTNYHMGYISMRQMI